MDLTLQADEIQLADMAGDVLSRETPLERWFAGGLDAAAEEDRLGALAAELGWIGFGAPEAIGGSAAAAPEEVVLFREVGRFLGPVSLVAGAVAARLVAETAPPLAAAIVAGEQAVALAIPRADGRAWRLGAARGSLCLLGDGEGLSLFEHTAGAAEPFLDPTVSAQLVPAAGKGLAASADPAAIGRYRLLVAAQALGIAEAALAASVAYAKLREQFGRPIGSFQAIRHRCVDMAVRCERARAQLFFAAVSLRDTAPDATFQALAAARACEDAASRGARDNIFIHGATGVTAENTAHLFLKRSLLWREVLRPAVLLEEIAAGTGPAP